MNMRFAWVFQREAQAHFPRIWQQEKRLKRYTVRLPVPQGSVDRLGEQRVSGYGRSGNKGRSGYIAAELRF